MGLSIANQMSMSTGRGCMASTKEHCRLRVAQDGNNKTIPIAFALVEGETKEGWSFFFLKNLRRHVTKGISVCMISDRHESIKSAFNDPRNDWQATGSAHVYCIRHIKQNFMRTIKDGDLKDVVNNICKNIMLQFFFLYRAIIK